MSSSLALAAPELCFDAEETHRVTLPSLARLVDPSAASRLQWGSGGGAPPSRLSLTVRDCEPLSAGPAAPAGSLATPSPAPTATVRDRRSGSTRGRVVCLEVSAVDPTVRAAQAGASVLSAIEHNDDEDDNDSASLDSGSSGLYGAAVRSPCTSVYDSTVRALLLLGRDRTRVHHDSSSDDRRWGMCGVRGIALSPPPPLPLSVGQRSRHHRPGSGIRVVGALTPRGPREPAALFALEPARFV